MNRSPRSHAAPRQRAAPVRRTQKRHISTAQRRPAQPRKSIARVISTAQRGVATDNPCSYHPPVFQARPLKVNITNVFDNRKHFRNPTNQLEIKFEIDHNGDNIAEDVDMKSEWVDTHLLNAFYDTCLDRYCPTISKKAKQIKPSNYRQAMARKMHKQAKEKELANTIRAAIDATPRYHGFQRQLAENRKLFGTYNPTSRDIEASGLDPDNLDDHIGRSFPDREFGV